MDIGCNRLENAVKPQQQPKRNQNAIGCNRLENAVKPQHNETPQIDREVVTD